MVAQIIENGIMSILLDEYARQQGYEEMRQDKNASYLKLNLIKTIYKYKVF